MLKKDVLESIAINKQQGWHRLNLSDRQRTGLPEKALLGMRK